MIDNQDKFSGGGVLGSLVDAEGELKDPSQCIIQYGGRVRLPDKLIEILNKEFVPEAMWWQPDGECFAFDSGKVQENILDIWFRGTKLSSFIRSLNRWGFRRVFYQDLSEAAVAFHHPAFRKKSTPELLKSMKMSKSGSCKVSAAKTEEPASAASLPKPMLRPVTASSPANTPSRLSPLSQAAARAASPGAGCGLSLLPQLPLPATCTRATSLDAATLDAAAIHQQIKQRSLELLALATESRRPPASPAVPQIIFCPKDPQPVRDDSSLSQEDPSLAIRLTSLPRSSLVAQAQGQHRVEMEEKQKKLLLLARAERELLLARHEREVRLVQQGLAQRHARQQQQQHQQQQQQNSAALSLALSIALRKANQRASNL